MRGYFEQAPDDARASRWRERVFAYHTDRDALGPSIRSFVVLSQRTRFGRLSYPKPRISSAELGDPPMRDADRIRTVRDGDGSVPARGARRCRGCRHRGHRRSVRPTRARGRHLHGRLRRRQGRRRLERTAVARPEDGECTLRAAIEQANFETQPSRRSSTPAAQTVYLTKWLPRLFAPMEIHGNGHLTIMPPPAASNQSRPATSPTTPNRNGPMPGTGLVTFTRDVLISGVRMGMFPCAGVAAFQALNFRLESSEIGFDATGTRRRRPRPRLA